MCQWHVENDARLPLQFGVEGDCIERRDGVMDNLVTERGDRRSESSMCDDFLAMRKYVK